MAQCDYQNIQFHICDTSSSTRDVIGASRSLLHPCINLFLYSFMVKTEAIISANKSQFSPSSLVSGTALAVSCVGIPYPEAARRSVRFNSAGTTVGALRTALRALSHMRYDQTFDTQFVNMMQQVSSRAGGEQVSGSLEKARTIVHY